MNRPAYEKAADVARELETAAYFCEVFECKYEQYPPRHPVNGKLTQKDKTIAVVEIKTRNNRSTKYPTVLMGSAKWERGKNWAHTENVPFIILIKFTDGVFMTVAKDTYEEYIGGRTDRADDKDMERCVYIPVDSFVKI
jgi:hypothetical protein